MYDSEDFKDVCFLMSGAVCDLKRQQVVTLFSQKF